MKNPTKTVKSCKNCTISEVWVQITGMPGEDRTDLTNPYPLFTNLKDVLSKEHQLQYKILPKKDSPVLFNIQTGPHKVSVFPPFWNGEIVWTEDNQKKILRVGHRFFAFHSLFDKNNPYVSYKTSFQKALQKIINQIDDSNIFEAIQIMVCYVNTIEISNKQNGSFNIGKYFNTNYSSQIQRPLLKTGFNFEFLSADRQNRVIGINANIAGNKANQSIINTIQTTGVNPLEKKTKLNSENVFNEIKSIKEELKEVFFDSMTEETKNNIMEVDYV